MMKIDKTKPVLVTGATGYVAGWLVKKLLEEGHTVHAAVRSPDDPKKTAALHEIAEGAPGNLHFYKADLLHEGSFAAAMEGCEVVFHTASPFTTSVDDPEKELIEPALEGTRNVLNQATQTPTVKRVVLTSSCAAIYGDNRDLKKTENGVFTEDDWNSSSTPSYQSYSYSKTVAEKEAWMLSKGQTHWKLVTINPSLVMGPALNPEHVTSESFQLLKQFGDGTLKTGVPNLGMGVVDVRDVAEAHYRAAFTPEAEGRFIISAHDTTFLKMAQALEPYYGEQFPLPSRELPKFLIWLFGPLLNKSLTRKYVARNIGYDLHFDNSKSKKVLGFEYRPLDETMNDAFSQIVNQNLI